ncbi:nicotinate-nucleotide--dimethylbenzimidazole phosphoribosyltransferase [uncultured Algimonas sp.]|uniref:nicotinate-nucleotide--dimethylbenzimidazole phosphoribosyltransferase n=1 Tax=uncultured Algimonas sp. TaxID=1547920 RepID=UPI002630DEAA|nr:nicotinate-nucleotide--dimethylbenzimidazole phosphoribosyltransferase [uncultured Algimonas sp.]
MTERRPFDDVRDLAGSVPGRDTDLYADIMTRADCLGHDLCPLGSLAAPLARIASIQGQSSPNVTRPLVAVFTGSHATVADASARVADRVAALSSGRAAVRGAAQQAGAAFKVYEFGNDHPSDDFRQGPSLSERDCAGAIAFGMEVVAEGADVIVLGNAGYGSATAAAAIARGLYGGAADYWAGGQGDKAAVRIDTVAAGAQANAELLSDPLGVLRAFGGRDLAGTVGAILACAHQHIPVILDGYVVCAAAAVVHALNPDAVAHCIAGHATAEPAQRALLDRMDLDPVLDLDINIGDGTGGVFALGLLQSANSGLSSLDGG